VSHDFIGLYYDYPRCVTWFDRIILWFVLVVSRDFVRFILWVVLGMSCDLHEESCKDCYAACLRMERRWISLTSGRNPRSSIKTSASTCFFRFNLKTKHVDCIHSFIRMSMSCLLHKILQCHVQCSKYKLIQNRIKSIRGN